MGLLSQIALVAGVFLVGLVALATLVAGWELLRQRELIEMLRRDRAAFAATSPLPLAASTSPAPGPAFARLASSAPAGSASATGVKPVGVRRDTNWIETRPMVLSHVPAVDDELVVRARQLDLSLE
jgi:hypothetical protein